MSINSHTGPQFEDEVRNIARNLYSNSFGQGSQVIDGRERDGVFWNGHFFTVIEATTLKTKDKAETDGKKTHELVLKLRQDGHMAQGLLVTLYEPTPDQKQVIKTKRYDRTIRIISFDELRAQLFDTLTYINNREKKRFGSVYDHVDNNFEIPLSDFVEPTILDLEAEALVSFPELSDELRLGKRYVLMAEYGVGKSMVLRHLFHRTVTKVRTKVHFRTPVAINLREHLGQTEPVELLERHARANAVDPQKLVAAWNAGYVDLLIDGFDELSTRGWTGDIRRLKEYRRATHSVVRKLIKETPPQCGIFIAGREGYFDSISEMREALGVPTPQFRVCRILPFDENQASDFLRKKGYSGPIPDWLPTRPLLLTYLATKKLLLAAVNAEVSGDFPRGTAWLALIDMISQRESEQLEGVDKEALLRFLGALGIHARQTPGGQTSFSPQYMENLFSDVAGVTIIEDERNLLLRLPGLGAAQDSALNRSFIDFDFLNVCCALPVLGYVRDPYTDQSKIYKFDGLVDPMSDVGVESLAALLAASKIQVGAIYSAIDHAITNGLYQLAFDIFRAAQKFGPRSGADFLTFSGVAIGEIDLASGEYDGAKVYFADCLVDRVVLPTPEETNKEVNFFGCLIGQVEGRGSNSDLDNNQFVDCDVAEFSDEYSVNNAVLESSLPLGVRVLVVTLRKLFTQGGLARLESALFRGLDQRAKLIVPNVLGLLIRHGFVVETGRKGKTTYSGTKSKRHEALSIIRAPNTADSQILRDCRSIS
ncbi:MULTISPECIES: NACHT domain-containing protein [Rhizobium/Agrobacterium group]|uniref:NACHT domain-containing protein n=1 Tax=Rhizobium/Agrobacterium group TaxID=227290 RepID=UPI000B3FEB18|nr:MULTISPECIES: NACHT domain-containing protein [Rhizobium/Agrobacterium group]MCF1482619.1 NACHT domain-containing protein [Allorhizobium ampelinum]NSZ43738.1 NACHT domain-containing protein [Agrobacterium vitis]NTA27485.1 NACHT domain-containing protein [Allorhizobium ampelinum]OVE94537.1 hypothetical protein B7W85_13395 [Allorhizobium ampelinum]